MASDPSHQPWLPPLSRWVEYLVAIVLGNAVYFYSLVPHLPAALRHRPFRVDAGLVIDFLVCVGVYGLWRLVRRVGL